MPPERSTSETYGSATAGTQERVQEIRQGRAATSALDNAKNIARSVEEYKKGVSSWNFDVAALKAQAEAEPDDGVPSLSTISEVEEDTPRTTSTPSKPSSAFAVSSAQNTLATLGILEDAASLPSPLGGRFQIYGSGDEPPPMSPPAPNVLKDAEATGASSLSQHMERRTTDENVKQFDPKVGARPILQPEASTGFTDAVASMDTGNAPLASSLPSALLSSQTSLATVSMPTEPKKKGRFMIIENATSADYSSMPSMGLSSSLGRMSDSGAAQMGSVGRPPVPPPASSALAAGANIPVSFMLPKLYELLEQSSQQQAAVQKLVAAALEAEQGKGPLSMSGRGLGPASLHPANPPALSRLSYIVSESDIQIPEDLDMDALRARMAAVEVENSNLRLRNHFLEGLLGPAAAGVLGGTRGTTEFAPQLPALAAALAADSSRAASPVPPK
eukprot:gene1380-32747_t